MRSALITTSQSIPRPNLSKIEGAHAKSEQVTTEKREANPNQSTSALDNLRCFRQSTTTTSGYKQFQETFKQQFSAKAKNPKEFHAFMKQVFGANYDRAKAEQFRNQALHGNFSFLPPIQFVNNSVLQGAHGAYDSEKETVYLNINLLSNPKLAAETFVEEAGHHLDNALNKADTAGDEGEMFRRILGGEKLSQAQIKDIQNENDKGVIRVDGKEVEVEFWNPFKAAWNGIKKAGKAVGKALGKAAKSTVKAAGSVLKGIGSAIGGAIKGVAEGVGGFCSNIVKGKIGQAFKELGQGLDRGILQAPGRLLDGLFDGAKHLVDGVGGLLGPLGKPFKIIGHRIFDAGRTITSAAAGIVRDIVRTPIEMAADFLKNNFNGFKELFKGNFGQAFKHFGMSYVNAAGRLLGGAVDAVMRGVAALVSSGSTVLGLEPPSRELSNKEKCQFRELYGDSVNLDLVQVKRGSPVSLGASKTVGNTIYLADDCYGANGKLNERGRETLAHEMGHVWQNQNGGGDYIHKALASQFAAAVGSGSRNGAYNWEEAMNAGLSFQELNPEQQAALMEDMALAMQNNTFNASGMSSEKWAYYQAALKMIRAGNGAP